MFLRTVIYNEVFRKDDQIWCTGWVSLVLCCQGMGKLADRHTAWGRGVKVWTQKDYSSSSHTHTNTHWTSPAVPVCPEDLSSHSTKGLKSRVLLPWLCLHLVLCVNRYFEKLFLSIQRKSVVPKLFWTPLIFNEWTKKKKKTHRHFTKYVLCVLKGSILGHLITSVLNSGVNVVQNVLW